MALARLRCCERSSCIMKIGRAHSELQSLAVISYAVFCLKKKNRPINAVDHKLVIVEERVEHRSQFVAHMVEELRFGLARQTQVLALVGNRAEQTGVLDRQ